MKILGIFFAVAIILGALSVSGIISYNLFHIFLAVFEGAKELKPEVYVPLSITVATAVFGLTATLYTQVSNRKREIDSAYRERKLEIYLQFLKTLEKLALATKPELGGQPTDINKLTVELMDIRTKAVLWGSPKVLQSISQMSKMSEGDTATMFKVMDNIQRNMRKDLGLSNMGLGDLFFVKLSLTDPKELDVLLQGK